MQIVSLILTVIMTLYVFLRQHKYSVVQACVKGAGFFTVGCYLDIIFSLIMTGMGANGSNQFLQWMGIFVSKGIMIAVLMVGIAVEQEYAMGTTGRDWQYLDGLTVGITLFFLFIAILVRWGVYADSGAHGDTGLMWAWILTFFLAALLAYEGSYYLYGKKQREKRRQFQEEAGKHESDVYLENVEEQYQRTRELWHDLKNHITLLSLLLEEGKYVQMKDYLHIFAEDVDALTLPMKSGNLVVDALLADKMAKARKRNIAFRLSLCNLTNIPLKPNEICGILGNLLDNSLEANDFVQENRFIVVECEEKEYCYYIRVRNSAANSREDFRNSHLGQMQSGKLREDCHSIKSDRRNQVGHGLGLRSVERIVHGCGGELAVDRTANQFIVAVRLPKEAKLTL